MSSSSASSRRVALVADAGFYVGPDLARVLAARGHDLVLGDPEAGLVDELESTGAAVEVVTGARDLSDPAAAGRLVGAAMGRFGRLDAAAGFSGRIVVGRFIGSTIDDLRAVVGGCLEAPFHFLQAVLPPMLEQSDGQVLVITSAAGSRPTPGAPLYSSARAGANMLVRNVAGEGRIVLGAPSRVAFEPRRGWLYVADSSNNRIVALTIPKISSRPIVAPRPAAPASGRKAR
jgi:3-oxoacyl-[acyl-carrier protein] reductase